METSLFLPPIQLSGNSNSNPSPGGASMPKKRISSSGATSCDVSRLNCWPGGTPPTSDDGGKKPTQTRRRLLGALVERLPRTAASGSVDPPWGHHCASHLARLSPSCRPRHRPNPATSLTGALGASGCLSVTSPATGPSGSHRGEKTSPGRVRSERTGDLLKASSVLGNRSVCSLARHGPAIPSVIPPCTRRVGIRSRGGSVPQTLWNLASLPIPWLFGGWGLLCSSPGFGMGV